MHETVVVSIRPVELPTINTAAPWTLNPEPLQHPHILERFYFSKILEQGPYNHHVILFGSWF